MGKLEHIEFEQQSDNIKNRVTNYWTERSEGFFELRHEEIESNKAERWVSKIKKMIPADKSLKILDIGCGAGFFEILLGREGYSITGIDLTDKMIDKTKEMIALYHLDPARVTAEIMDAEKLDYNDETFDIIITRNLTWTLPHPAEAYLEWKRVLKKGGILLNFDAEFAKGEHRFQREESIAHSRIKDELRDECHNIYHLLTISTLNRPDWDIQILNEVGFSEVDVDLQFGSRIFIEKDQFYIPDMMFSIKAIKH